MKGQDGCWERWGRRRQLFFVAKSKESQPLRNDGFVGGFEIQLVGYAEEGRLKVVQDWARLFSAVRVRQARAGSTGLDRPFTPTQDGVLG